MNSELRAQGHPRAALLGFSIAVLAYNVLAVLKKSVEHANRKEASTRDASTYYMAARIDPKRVNTAKHKRRPRTPKVYADSSPPGSHVSTAKVLRQAREVGSIQLTRGVFPEQRIHIRRAL